MRNNSGRNKAVLAVLLSGGLMVGAAATVSAQDLAMATPGPNSEFVVFANKDGRTLSPTALNIVRKAAREAGGAKVTLIGRAEETATVKQALERQGVPGSAIAVRHEARAPIPQTDDGLSDPVSRRVEIKL
ncbi:MAG TPA: hypothetical protein VFB13_00035 [Reyranella sp.]|jgi:hypothetical protein|nr:hypothetical protein [Reyranella sp.]